MTATAIAWIQFVKLKPELYCAFVIVRARALLGGIVLVVRVVVTLGTTLRIMNYTEFRMKPENTVCRGQVCFEFRCRCIVRFAPG